jgi:hypothetical protein
VSFFGVLSWRRTSGEAARRMVTRKRRSLQQGRLLSPQARKSLTFFFVFVLFLEHAVFDDAEFDNRNFEGESFFNKSSVSHVKHVTMKNNSR